MAFFDWLTGNSDEKRNEKNRAKDLQSNLNTQQNQTFNTAMPWIGQAQENISGLFNPDAFYSNNAILDKSLENQQGSLDQAKRGYEQMAATPGYTAEEGRNIKLGATAPVAGAYGSAAGQVANRAALTGNSMGLIPAQAELARAKAREISQAATGAEAGIANQRIAGTQHALAGLGNVSSGYAQMGNTALDRGDSERSNAVAGLVPAQTAQGFYSPAVGNATNLTSQQYQHGTSPGGLGNWLGQNIGGAVSGIVGATRKKKSDGL